jgi:diguanylate cyclase (GGDEF)-like protein/PAS domain S-box-containing protein
MTIKEINNNNKNVLSNHHRALHVLRECNKFMFLSDNEQELLDEVCRIIVEDGGYLLAWIGFAQHDESKSIKPVAHCGYEEGYLESCTISWGDTKYSTGPAGATVLTGQPHVVRNVLDDPDFLPWRDAAIEKGYSSVAAFPIVIRDQSLPAVILMYASEPDAFDEEELEFLNNLSDSLASGIDAIRIKMKHEHDMELLRAHEERFSYMLDHSPIAARIAINKGTFVTYANPAYSKLIDIEIGKIIGSNPKQYYPDQNEYDYILEKLKQGETINNLLIKLINSKGHIKWTLASFITIQFDGEEANLGWFFDITDRKQMEDELKHLATHDPLTGLFNRNVLEQRLNEDIARATRYDHHISLFVMDIDHFKSINDTYGHQAGDIVLRDIADLLNNSIRSADYTARFGGEEFIVVLPETTLIKAEELAIRLCKIFADHDFPIDENNEIQLTVSIGIAAFPEQGKTVNDLFAVADALLYKAKKAGRNQVKTPLNSD